MEQFKEYLKSRYHYTQSSLEIKVKHILQYENLCSTYQKLETLSFAELLKIIEIQRKKYSIVTVNNQLHSLECYFYFLMELGVISENPLENFRIKSEKPKLLQGFLTVEEMDFIYEKHPKSKFGKYAIYTQRNKIILGLLVYQGISTGTLEVLKISDIDLEKAQINIPKTSERKLNARILPLESVQILALNEYLSKGRKELVGLVKSLENSDLLFPKKEKSQMKAVTKAIKTEVQKHFTINHLQQLRISRIRLWMKQYNLREVQYKSGYKCLSSLEKYNQNELESLQEAVAKYHSF
jgi:integrase/recombinase XerC